MTPYLTRFASALSLAVAVLAMGASVDQKKETKMIQGTVVSASTGSLVIANKDNKESTHAVASSVKVTIEGKMAKVENLKKGMKVTIALDGDKVLSINSSNPTKR